MSTSRYPPISYIYLVVEKVHYEPDITGIHWNILEKKKKKYTGKANVKHNFNLKFQLRFSHNVKNNILSGLNN